MSLSLYFDAAASTPVSPGVRDAMNQVQEHYGNNNSKHHAGFAAQKVIDQGLKTIAKVLDCKSEQLCIMYSGTDANRRFLQIANDQIFFDKPGHKWGEFTFASSAEHSSVADELLPNNRFDPVSFDGLGDQAKLIALMGANSETGRQYDVKTLRDAHPESVILHDVSQSFAKGVKPDLKLVDAAVFTPQKFYGPKHIGVLYLQHPERFPILAKDSHTKSPELLAGAAQAFLEWGENHQDDQAHLADLTEQLRDGLQQHIPDLKFHDANADCVPGLLNVAFKGIRGGQLMSVLSAQEQICISIGSACTSDIMVPTDYILSIEPDPLWQYPIRLSLHRFLKPEDITHLVEVLTHYVGELKNQ